MNIRKNTPPRGYKYSCKGNKTRLKTKKNVVK